MRSEDPTMVLSCIDVELLVAALVYYEQKFRVDRPEHLAEKIRALRQRLLDA